MSAMLSAHVDMEEMAQQVDPKASADAHPEPDPDERQRRNEEASRVKNIWHFDSHRPWQPFLQKAAERIFKSAANGELELSGVRTPEGERNVENRELEGIPRRYFLGDVRVCYHDQNAITSPTRHPHRPEWVKVRANRSEFENWLSSKAKAEEPDQITPLAHSSPSHGPSQRRGRQPGDGSLAKADAPLVELMHEMLQRGDAASRTSAARQLWKERETMSVKIEGASEEAAIDRLARRYSQKYPRGQKF
jgi:hypothetical protein